MQIDRILYPVEALGPGKRLVIWTIGCTKHCFHCSNQELWKSDVSRDIPLTYLSEMLKKQISDRQVDGVTFTGGDPLEQMDEMLCLLGIIKPMVNDILVYTGYYVEELIEKYGKDTYEKIKKYISVLIDGRYIENRNTQELGLIGSSNQTIHYFDTELKEIYEKYINKGRTIQNFYWQDRIISVGIHDREDGIL